jgi:TonB family protein
VETKSAGALVVSVSVHCLCFLLAAWAASQRAPSSERTAAKQALNREIVWLEAPGPSGGGGSGGNHNPLAPRLARLKGTDKVTVPVLKASEPETPRDAPPEDPVHNLVIPAETLAAANTLLIGSIEGIPSADSLGPGVGGGAGTNEGRGDGPGRGDGLGPGYGSNVGGGPMRPGGDVESPIPIAQPKPQYTAEAMRAKVQGRILVECVVLPDGTTGAIHVVRTLSPAFGLDQEAIKAVRAWRFRPGMRRGQPVPVLVSIELAFALR